jgi:acyl-ACP thioesterase
VSEGDLVPVPTQGRTFTGDRRVRLGDVAPSGRVRLDALARFLQDISYDDTHDAGLDPRLGWVVRRTVMEIERWPRYGEAVNLLTFCGGIGSRWSERRVSMSDADGPLVEAATMWVHVDPDSGRPKHLPQQFHDLFGEAAGGRVVSARLHHHDPPAEAGSEPWSTRSVDFDVHAHMNNAVYWAALEHFLPSDTRLLPVRAELEFRHQVTPDDSVTLRSLVGDGTVDVWLTGAEGAVHASGALRPLVR